MGSTYTNLFFHVVFSTKDRRPYIEPHIRDRLYNYMGGIVKSSDGMVCQAGGVADHVHLLIAWNPHTPLSELLQQVKSNSTRWLKKTYPELHEFSWQSGYAAFSVSFSQTERVTRYIQNQEAHHKKMDFREEFLGLLRAHNVDFDERYIFE